jgi:hypothetical protein
MDYLFNYNTFKLNKFLNFTFYEKNNNYTDFNFLFLNTYADIIQIPACKPWQDRHIGPVAVCDPYIKYEDVKNDTYNTKELTINEKIDKFFRSNQFWDKYVDYPSYSFYEKNKWDNFYLKKYPIILFYL